jgi:hypothetical protein
MLLFQNAKRADVEVLAVDIDAFALVTLDHCAPRVVLGLCEAVMNTGRSASGV